MYTSAFSASFHNKVFSKSKVIIDVNVNKISSNMDFDIVKKPPGNVPRISKPFTVFSSEEKEQSTNHYSFKEAIDE